MRDLPLVMPAPTWFTMGDLERQSQGTGTVAKQDLSYILSYRLFYKEAGNELNIGAVMPGLAAAVMEFLDGVIDNDSPTGAIDMRPIGSPVFGIVEDPVGKAFWGADIDLEILEFI